MKVITQLALKLLILITRNSVQENEYKNLLNKIHILQDIIISHHEKIEKIEEICRITVSNIANLDERITEWDM